MAYAKTLLRGSRYIVLIFLTIILGLWVVIFLWLNIGVIRRWIRPPEGLIAEHLAKLDHSSDGNETNVVDKLFAGRSTINLLGKRRETEVERALSAAKFGCVTISPTEKRTGHLFCINRSAGCTDQGNIRIWMVIGTLNYKDHTTANVSEIRSFIKSGGYC